MMGLRGRGLLLLVGGDRLGRYGSRRLRGLGLGLGLGGAWWVGFWRDVSTCCRDLALGHLMRETKGNLSEQVTQKCIQHSHKDNIIIIHTLYIYGTCTIYPQAPLSFQYATLKSWE